MPTTPDRLNEIYAKLETLLKKQESFSKEILELKQEIDQLRNVQSEGIVSYDPADAGAKAIIEKATAALVEHRREERKVAKRTTKDIFGGLNTAGVKNDLEKFIGENLINKIGIVITIIGVAIGAKYAIDHRLVSPLTRIILGYLMGGGLLGFSFTTRRRYENFSAVLLSGGMSIMYFITYAASTFYGLIPHALAFILMALFTVFTCMSAISYNKQVVAHIGLVGAYGVPFLLNEGSGKVVVLFAYIAIINAGVLFLAFKRYWKPLYYAAFVLTWMVFFSWFESQYVPGQHFGLGLTFLSVYFVVFYLTFLSYKLFRAEVFEIEDIVLLLANSFVFYGIGYQILENHEFGEKMLGLFTIMNAVIHALVAFVIYKRRLADRNLLFFVMGLVLVYLTIAIPVQLDGSWVTLLWTGEAVILFWIGRTRGSALYEKLSYPLMALAFLSLVQDWTTLYGGYDPENPETRVSPFMSIRFLTSTLFIAGFGIINFLNRNNRYSSALASNKGWKTITSFAIPAILLFALYYSIRLEIETYWNQLYLDSTATGAGEVRTSIRNHDLIRFRIVWVINYTCLFFAALSFVNIRRFASELLGIINLSLNAIAILVFLAQGLYELSELRESYLGQNIAAHATFFNIAIRYISYAFVALLLVTCVKYNRQEFMRRDFGKALDGLIHVSMLWIASSELINWMDIADSSQSYKLGLSILWGSYSLLLISLGIWKKKRHLRIGAIALLGVTLIKLFLYDISHLDTLAKTIVLVALGILLLVISFLYNKYRHAISPRQEQ